MHATSCRLTAPTISAHRRQHAFDSQSYLVYGMFPSQTSANRACPLYNRAVLHHGHHVRRAYGAEAMRNHKHRATNRDRSMACYKRLRSPRLSSAGSASSSSRICCNTPVSQNQTDRQTATCLRFISRARAIAMRCFYARQPHSALAHRCVVSLHAHINKQNRSTAVDRVPRETWR